MCHLVSPIFIWNSCRAHTCTLMLIFCIQKVRVHDPKHLTLLLVFAPSVCQHRTRKFDIRIFIVIFLGKHSPTRVIICTEYLRLLRADPTLLIGELCCRFHVRKQWYLCWDFPGSPLVPWLSHHLCSLLFIEPISCTCLIEQLIASRYACNTYLAGISL